MEVSIRRRFEQDLKKLRLTNKMHARVLGAIEDLSGAKTLREVTDVKKLKARKNEYRIRVGDLRLILLIEGNIAELTGIKRRKENTYS